VQAGFRELAAEDPAGWVVLDGDQDVDALAERIEKVVRDRLHLA
jgi:thymidylate kinase